MMNKVEKFWLWISNKFFDIKYAISDWLFPKQKWLIKKIPNRWIDKDLLLEIVILESLKHFVEYEKGDREYDYYSKKTKDLIDSVSVLSNKKSKSTNNISPSLKTFYKELKKIYKIITVDIPKLEKQIDEKTVKFSSSSSNDNDSKYMIKFYRDLYFELYELENKLYELKTKVMVWIIKNRKNLWV